MLSFTRYIFSQYVLHETCWRFQTFDKCNVTQLTRIEAMNEYVMRHDGRYFFFKVFKRFFNVSRMIGSLEMVAILIILRGVIHTDACENGNVMNTKRN